MTTWPRVLLLLLSMFGCVGALRSQPNESVKQLVVMVTEPEAGTGLIVGFDDGATYVVTAKHVVMAASSQRVTLYPGLRWQRDAQNNTQPAKDRNCSTLKKSDNMDIALLRCETPGVAPWLLWHKFDLVSASRETRRSSRVTFIGNVQTPWFSPSAWGFVSEISDQQILVANTFGMDVTGASGGPLLSEDGHVVGIITGYDRDTAQITVVPWSKVDEWIRLANPPAIRALQSASRPPLGPGDTEVAVSYQTFEFPVFGGIPSPLVRISKRLPHLGQSILAFDFSAAGNPNLSPPQIRALRVTLPVVSFQYQLGQSIPLIRRTSILGGIYVASGLGFAVQDSRETGGDVLQEENVRSWAGVFEAGARYRWPGRSWGIQGNYREYVLTEQGPGVIYPRFRSYGVGLFVVIR